MPLRLTTSPHAARTSAAGLRKARRQELRERLTVRRSEVTGTAQRLRQPTPSDERYAGDTAAEPRQLRADEAEGTSDTHVGTDAEQLGRDGDHLPGKAVDEPGLAASPDAGMLPDDADEASAPGDVGYEGAVLSDPGPEQRHRTLGSFFRNRETGDVVVAQLPNIPLVIFLAATAVRLLLSPQGVLGTVVAVLGTASLAVWALMEVWNGDSPFRRVLGGLVLLATVVGAFTR